jgi:uncharacterized membrane protein
MKKFFRRYFITGLLIVVPLYVAGYVLVLIVTSMDELLTLLPEVARPSTYLPFHIPGLGLLITIVLIFIIGVLARNFFGRALVRFGESLLERIPIVRTIYKASKQFLETFFTSDRESFNRVVMLQFPRKGLYAIGFVTCVTRGEIQLRTGEQTVNVFIPTTPNPTSGFYFAVPEEDIIPLEMTVEEAFKVIMSGGLVVPESSELTVKVNENKGKAFSITSKNNKN